MFMVILLLAIVLCAFKIWQIENERHIRMIKKIPGPKTLPVIGNALDILRNPVSLFHYGRNLANSFNGMTKLRVFHMSAINIYDPPDVEIQLSNHNNLMKGYIYNYVRPWLQDGLLTTTGEKWQSRRKILTPAFHFNILREFCNVFFEQSERVSQMLKLNANNSEIEILPFLTEYALNSISETAMGTSLDSVQNDVKNYKQSVYKMGELIVDRFTKVWLSWTPIYNLTNNGRIHNNAIYTLHNFTSNVINERRKERTLSGIKFSPNHCDKTDEFSSRKRLAMLDLLLTAEEDGTIDENGIKEEVTTFMFEGHDTTTIGLSYLLMVIANYHYIQERILSEINEIFEDENDPISMDKLNKMNYLERCIKESLRLYPSVPFISRTLKEDVQFTKYLVPAGIECAIHIFDLHRNPKYFPNPYKFDPDRFLPENSIDRHPYAYIPFSAGPRNCIGQKFAILEEKSIVTEILRNFKLEAVTKPEDIVFYSDIVLRCRDPIKVKFIRRQLIKTL